MHNPLWNPFADMGAVDGHRFVLARGEGVWVYDRDGKRYLDATAALWYANLGHGRPEIAEAVGRQLRTLDAYSIFADFANEPALELAERLAELAPLPDSRVFLGSGGGDMVDGAAKIARSYFAQRGEAERTYLIGREHGYHGTHGIGTSVGGIPANALGFGGLVEDAATVAYDDAAALEAEIERVGAQRVAAFFCEPVIGAGGVYAPPDGYIEEVAAICARHGVLFVADCVICAFGRLGTWLGIDRWPVKPDMVTLAKGVTAGTLPLGALIVAPHVAQAFWTGEPGAPTLRHGQTYAGHPTACAAANTVLGIYRDENLIARGRELEAPLADALAPLAENPAIVEVRSGLGFLAAAEVDPELLARDAGFVQRWVHACRAEGVLVRQLGRGVAVSPPLVTGEEELELLGDVMARTLEHTAAVATR
ncbi:MAG TPA: aminotransferase class III-fold pyridoxal phosphate-dependent enzyme [Solirubrobacteraceae bacterium]|nr:aminotransferase class III-fold pyridoxal phosphate-dependent enzyme [Solirubrobacteraceae bacterium]